MEVLREEVSRGDAGEQGLRSSRRKHTDRPRFHVMPRAGWMNDPNGPICFNGQYHLFYQQVVSGITWSYGIVWGHATSRDLVHWEDLPPALVPTAGGPDANGCFSGCCVLDPVTGLPTILYTGVRLRTNEECGPLPPEDCDLRLEFIESQCMAVADPCDPKLINWTKSSIPILPHPPSGMCLTGWRDPFLLESEGPSKEWTMLIGSGIRGVGGAILKYKSRNLSSGWTYSGVLCAGDEGETGTMWECPILACLTPHPTKSGTHRPSRSSSGVFRHSKSQDFEHLGLSYGEGSLGQSFEGKGFPLLESCSEAEIHLFCVSPDAPTNPVLYWIGETRNETFYIEGAEGPFRLDIGDVLYAPNLTRDPQLEYGGNVFVYGYTMRRSTGLLIFLQGRLLLWGWLQERPNMGEQDYAGCLSVPRMLHLCNGKLFQEPAPEIYMLRSEKQWHEIGLNLFPEESTPLEGVGGDALDIELTIEKGSSSAAGVIIRAYDGSVSGVILFDWERMVLEVVRGAMHSEMGSYNEDRVGGGIDLKPGDPLEMRILLDNSCLEIFTGTGEVLSTRVYRGRSQSGADAGIDFVAYGGVARLARVMAFEMTSIWKDGI